MDTRLLRDQIDRGIAAGVGAPEIQQQLRLFWEKDSGPAAAAFVLSRFERLRPALAVTAARVAVLRSFTIEPVVPVVKAAASVNGIALDVYVGGYNAWAQEILNPESALYRYDPQVVFLTVESRSLVPKLWDAYTELANDDIELLTQDALALFTKCVETLRARSRAAVILHTLELPLVPSNGILDAQLKIGQVSALQEINRGLFQIARQHAGVFMLDYDALVARHGRVSWYDERKRLTVGLPLAAHSVVHLATEWLRFIHPLVGKTCKVLVTDLDNTLWGGVVGEDGPQGIALGAEYPGASYQVLQRAILDLYHRGVILAVCSKNNPADALEVIENHPGMLLRQEHFAAMRINWNDKAQNLREISAELNLGIDALAFLDDNPVEREWIRQQLPEVTVIEVPTDPMRYADTLRGCPVFERLTLSAEDRERSRYYAAGRLRTDLKDHASSLEEFYYSLGMQAEVSLMSPDTLARATQLTQKTNQFNLTIRRYSDQQMAAFAADPAWRVYLTRVVDRFGDNGIVGLVIASLRDGVCDIDTFLMSCRVVGRTVETAMFATVAEQARLSGATRLTGTFRRTKKNQLVEDLLPRHGFTCNLDDGQESRWDFDLAQGDIQLPPWIKREYKGEGFRK